MSSLIQNIKDRRKTNNNGSQIVLADHRSLNADNSNVNSIRVNLQDYGYSQAGKHDGNPSALKNHLDMIRSGQIIDENSNEEKYSKIREEIDENITGLKVEISNCESDIRNVNDAKIPSVDSWVKNLNEEIDEVDLNILKSMEPVKRNWFHIVEYGLFGLLAMVFLYMFYVSAVHSAFFRDIASELANAQQSQLKNIMNTVFNVQAYKEFDMHWLAPFVFFIFAIILHVTWRMTSSWRIPAIICTLLFILSADGLIAYFIEANNHKLSVLMGLAEEGWKFYHSPVFYAVLMFGFFSCLAWSISLFQFQKEFPLQNRHAQKIAEKQKGILRKKIWNLEQEKIALNGEVIQLEKKMDGLKLKIEHLKQEKGRVSYSIPMLKKNISSFYNGWLSYVNGKRDAREKVAECETVKDDFLYELNTK